MDPRSRSRITRPRRDGHRTGGLSCGRRRNRSSAGRRGAGIQKDRVPAPRCFALLAGSGGRLFFPAWFSGCLFQEGIIRRTALFAVAGLLAACGRNSSGAAQSATFLPPAPGERHLRNIRQLTSRGNNAEAYFSRSGKQMIFQRQEKVDSALRPAVHHEHRWIRHAAHFQRSGPDDVRLLLRQRPQGALQLHVQEFSRMPAGARQVTWVRLADRPPGDLHFASRRVGLETADR